ncbi:hypothetical protein [Mycolicibacterium smegmatis]|nr:hypothetical protein [Mycolicibacterium smegmatis]
MQTRTLAVQLAELTVQRAELAVHRAVLAVCEVRRPAELSGRA